MLPRKKRFPLETQGGSMEVAGKRSGVVSASRAVGSLAGGTGFISMQVKRWVRCTSSTHALAARKRSASPKLPSEGSPEEQRRQAAARRRAPTRPSRAGRRAGWRTRPAHRPRRRARPPGPSHRRGSASTRDRGAQRARRSRCRKRPGRPALSKRNREASPCRPMPQPQCDC